MLFRNSIPLIILLSTADLVHAHPGHGAGDGNSLLHYLTEAPHLPVLLTTVLVLLLLRRHLPFRTKTRETINKHNNA